MAHPSAHRMPAKDRRDQLLDTALDIFSQRGFEGATTKEIAAAAGVTEAVIFRHFPSKQALYQAVLDLKLQSGELQSWVAKYKTCIERNDDEGLIRLIAEKIIHSYRTDQRIGRVLLFAALEGHEQGLEYNRQIGLPIAKELSKYIALRQSQGAIRRGNPGLVVAAIAGMTQHYGMMTGMFGFCANLPDEEVIDTFVDIVMSGIRVPKKDSVKVTKR